MGFQFAETMAGTIEWSAEPGARHPFRMELTALADSTRDYIATGQAVLRGVVHAPPRADSVDAEGVITIRPIGARIIRYELTFVGDDGKGYELVGQKDIRWWAPFRTFTHLPADILDENRHRVATCATVFDLRHDWWSFLRSFRPA
ncbi:MAG TPA: hypothetical protein VGO00_16770 [Kofleriaceae bacterium]|jgi:hypothetical protein|nr:hypothetical protein [Kofleriaceae bacterium]